MKPLRIGIEAQRIFRKKKHGMDMVALNLIKQLQLIDTFNEYFIFVKNDEDSEVLKASSNFKIIAGGAGPYPIWEQFYLPKMVKKYQLDILHCTSNTAPLSIKKGLVTTIHDIIYLEGIDLKKGTWYQRFGNIYRKFVVPSVFKNSKIVITVSEFEKKRMEEYFYANSNPQKSKIISVYNGKSDHFKPLNKEEQQHYFKDKNIPDNFILFLGNADPKKNTIGLLKAYKIFASKIIDAPYLVMPDLGDEIFNKFITEANAEEIKNKIVLLPYVPNMELPYYYNKALFFVYPSIRESFGIPLIEAMACSVPVISSNTSCLPEIAGDAALYCDPFNEQDMAEKMIKLYGDENLRNELIQKGLLQHQKFSWENNAKQSLEIYKSL